MTASKQTLSSPSAFPSLALVSRDALLIAAGCTLLALGVNAVRPGGIRLVQREAYDILVPCPEPVGDAESLAASSPLVRDPNSLLLDVRSKEQYASWHMRGAVNQPFDWLGPPVDSEVKQVARRVAASGAQRVVVYGDGDDPDSGKEWARLLSGARIKNVFFVKGGAPALNSKLPKPADDEEIDDDAEATGDEDPEARSSTSTADSLPAREPVPSASVPSDEEGKP